VKDVIVQTQITAAFFLKLTSLVLHRLAASATHPLTACMLGFYREKTEINCWNIYRNKNWSTHFVYMVFQLSLSIVQETVRPAHFIQMYKVGGPDGGRRRCQRDGGRSERMGQKPLSTTFGSSELCLLWGTFWQIYVSRL